MCCFVILLLFNEMQMNVRRFSAIPHLRVLLGHEVCAIGFEKITCVSSFCQVAKSEWEPELYLWVNSSEFRNVSSGNSG